MNIWLPINKNMWTSSFAVFMAGISTLCLAVFFWLIDVRGYQRLATPFNILGMNALVIYIVSILVAKCLFLFGWHEPDGSFLEVREYLFQTFFEPWAPTITASLIYAITYVALMYLFAWGLWKKRIFIKL